MTTATAIKAAPRRAYTPRATLAPEDRLHPVTIRLNKRDIAILKAIGSAGVSAALQAVKPAPKVVREYLPVAEDIIRRALVQEERQRLRARGELL